MPARIGIKPLFLLYRPEVDLLGRDQRIGIINFIQTLNLLPFNLSCHCYLSSLAIDSNIQIIGV
jgi:hypothetical protein